jgi:hypothetical protein
VAFCRTAVPDIDINTDRKGRDLLADVVEQQPMATSAHAGATEDAPRRSAQLVKKRSILSSRSVRRSRKHPSQNHASLSAVGQDQPLRRQPARRPPRDHTLGIILKAGNQSPR